MLTTLLTPSAQDAKVPLNGSMCPFVTNVGRSLTGISLNMQGLSARAFEESDFSKLVTFSILKTYSIKHILGGFILERAALGKRIRESRISKGYTQQELADRAEIGVVYISEIERGIKMPSLNIFIKIVDALDVSADYVLRDELPSGEGYVYDEITCKLQGITPKQRKAVTAILTAYLCNMD